ncbi:MAG TPA: tetratricopeptide repeat protein [Longimicrobium sp.]|nr:tetratricopeptide repeat protein [Longimicrobium sp.]
MSASTSRPGIGSRSTDFTSPLTIPGGEVAGTEIVRELPPELALTVWQTLRSVLMWAAEHPAHRGELFEHSAMEQWELELLEGTFDPDLRFPLAVIVGELADAARATPQALARACLCVTEWGLAHNAVRTALGFTEAAALCWPDHPRYAWMAGRLLRAHGLLREAELWIKRSARVAGSMGDWEAQTLALNSLGNAFYEAGNYREAIRTLGEALRVSRKHRLRHREGEILHDLSAVSVWGGDLARGESFAMAAHEIYRTGHHRLPALAHDVAVLWIKRGQFARAFAVLKELPVFFDSPEDRIRVLASLARTAGACRDAPTFLQARSAAEALAADHRVELRSAPALLEIGLGAWELGEWEVAQNTLARAVRIAETAREADVRVQAESALGAVRERRSPENGRNPAEDRSAYASDPVVSRFLVSLQTGEFSAAA